MFRWRSRVQKLFGVYFQHENKLMPLLLVGGGAALITTKNKLY